MAVFHVLAGAKKNAVQPKIQEITQADIFDALRHGLDDFWDKPSHYVFLCLIYPVVGVVLITWTSGGDALQLVYPLITGFALLGPFAALGLYEISRRREKGLDTSWVHALEVRNSPAIPAIVAVGCMLLVLFVAWLYVAQGLYLWLYGSEPPESIGAFLRDVLTTQRGWTLIVLGNGAGFLFAVVVLLTVITFPLLLERDIGAVAAVQTSAKAVLSNPVPMMLWGLVVAAALVVASLPLFIGLALVVPVLGHATWHLYRKLILPPGARPKRPH
jgi:uncharacterized membrane protein